MTWAELEVPDAVAEVVSGGGGPPPRKRWRLREGRRAVLASVVFEVPDAPPSFEETAPPPAQFLEPPPAPLPASPGLEFTEPPTPPRRAVITWAEFQVPDHPQARGNDLEVMVVALTYLRGTR